ncbi:hypothetical protein ACFWY5_56635 [Nonomuraea sp. NPDC059007]|uniref:hypothetical protein n=1 Tax=Nonomuraea sp. NPDC059007 TaxID=3346692 RepID=UPI0036D0E5E7
MGDLGDTASWAGPPEEAIPYPPETRRADQSAGRRDGRRKLLADLLRHVAEEGEDGAPAPETAYLAMLTSEALERIAAERVARDDELARLGELHGQAVAAEDALARELEEAGHRLRLAEEECARPLTKDDLRRGPAELDPLTHPDALIERRRRTARENARLRALRAFEDLHARLDEQRERAVSLAERQELRPRVARARALRVHEHFRRRRAVYLTGLLARHPDPGPLNLLFKLSAPELPRWIRDEPTESA